MKVYLKPVPRTSAQGVTTKDTDIIYYTDKNGHRHSEYARKNYIKRGGATQTRRWLPKSYESGKIIIWSKDPVDNPYFNNSESIPSAWVDKADYIRKAPKLSEQEFYELKHNVSPNTYTERGNNFESLLKDTNVKPTYLEGVNKLFFDGITIFDTENPDDELFLKAIRESSKYGSSKYANSLADIKNKDNPEFYIVDEEAESKQDVNADLIEMGTYANLNKLITGASAADRYKFATILKLSDFHLISDEKITKLLIEYIKSPASKYDREKCYELFNSIFKEYVELESREKFELKYMIQEGLNRSIIFKKENEYMFSESDKLEPIVLSRIDTTIHNLSMKKNADLVKKVQIRLKECGVPHYNEIA